MAAGYILSIRDMFNETAQSQAFADIKADLDKMPDACLINEMPFIGCMVIAVDSDSALHSLRTQYDDRFHFVPEGTVRALRK